VIDRLAQRTRPTGPWIVFLTLALVVPGIIFVPGYRQVSLAATLAYVVIVWSALRLFGLTIDGRPRFLALTFWLFVYIFLGLAALAQVTSIKTALPKAADTSLMTLLGLVGFEMASLLRRGAKTPAAGRFFGGFVHPRRARVLALVSITCSIGLVLWLGSVDLLSASRMQRLTLISTRTNDVVWTSLIGYVLSAPIFASLVVLLLGSRKQERRGRWHRVILVMLVLLNLAINNPATSARFWSGTIVFSVVIVLAAPRLSRRRLSHIIIGVTAFFVLLFPLLDLFRWQVSLSGAEGVTIENPAISLESIDYDGFTQMNRAQQYVDANGLSYGRQMVGTLLFFIPRSAWPDKPLASGMAVGIFSHQQNTNLSMPLWGEGYMDFGYAGTFAALFLYGLVVRTMDSRYEKNGRERSLIAALVPVLSGYQFFLLRGSLMVTMPYLLPTLALVALHFGYSSKRTVVLFSASRRASM
jgi:oligosaccharide repeat unit polymerase